MQPIASVVARLGGPREREEGTSQPLGQQQVTGLHVSACCSPPLQPTPPPPECRLLPHPVPAFPGSVDIESPPSRRYGNFFNKGNELAKEAVEEDKQQNWAEALRLYTQALEYLATHLKYEKNAKSKELVSSKVRRRGIGSEWGGGGGGAGGGTCGIGTGVGEPRGESSCRQQRRRHPIHALPAR